MSNCDISLFEKVADDEGETQRLIRELNEEADRRFKEDPSVSRAQYFDELLDEAIEQETQRASRAEALALTTLRAREGLYGSFSSFKNEGVAADVALSQTVDAAGNSVLGEVARAQGQFAYGLEQAELDSYFAGLSRSDAEQINVLKEIAEVNKSGGRPGVTGSENARRIAEMYQTMVNSYRGRLKNLGVRVDDLEGRMLRQVWNRQSLITFGTKQDFVTAMYSRVDKMRTFGKPVKDSYVRRYLGRFYDARVAGELEDVPLDAGSALRERDTFARKQLYNREIHLLDAESTLFVMKNFGDGDVVGAMYNSLGGIARKTRVTELFGANPRQTVEALKRRAKREATPQEQQDIDNPRLSVRAWHGNLEAMMDIIDGSFEVMADPKLSMITHMLGNVTRTVFLQGVLLSSIPDVVTVQRAGARIGAEGLKNITARVQWSLDGLTDKTRQLMAGAVESANAYNLGAMTQRYATTTRLAKVTNFSATLSNATMKYGGVNAWTRQGKATAWVLASTTMSRLITAGTRFSELDNGVKGLLRRAQISEQDWDGALGKDGFVYKDGGHQFLDIDAIASADAALSRKFSDLLTNFTNDAIPTPGVRERSIITQGTQSGTIPGAMMRIMGSLMGYPITYITRQMSREAELGGGKGFAGLSMLAGSSLFAGYLSMVAVDLARGRNRDYTSTDVDKQVGMFLEAVGRGGFGGVIAGTLIDAIRFGDTAQGTLSGAPTAVFDSAINGVVKSAKFLATGDYDKAAATAGKTVRENLPFANLPYTRALFDTLVYHRYLEMTDPSVLSRMKKNWRRRTGGEYFLEE